MNLNQLNFAIKESIKLAPQAYENEYAKKIDAANQRLVTMEYQSFDLVKKNQMWSFLEIPIEKLIKYPIFKNQVLIWNVFHHINI